MEGTTLDVEIRKMSPKRLPQTNLDISNLNVREQIKISVK
jgi:hypothetical protein